MARDTLTVRIGLRWWWLPALYTMSPLFVVLGEARFVRLVGWLVDRATYAEPVKGHASR